MYKFLEDLFHELVAKASFPEQQRRTEVEEVASTQQNVAEENLSMGLSDETWEQALQ